MISDEEMIMLRLKYPKVEITEGYMICTDGAGTVLAMFDEEKNVIPEGRPRMEAFAKIVNSVANKMTDLENGKL